MRGNIERAYAVVVLMDHARLLNILHLRKRNADLSERIVLMSIQNAASFMITYTRNFIELESPALFCSSEGGIIKKDCFSFKS